MKISLSLTVLSFLSWPITALFMAGTASAQLNRWTGTTSGNWNTASNWSNNGVPNAGGTDALFSSTGLNPMPLSNNINNWLYKP